MSTQDDLVKASAAVQAKGDVTDLHRTLADALSSGRGVGDAVAAIRSHFDAYCAAFAACMAAVAGHADTLSAPGPSEAPAPSVSPSTEAAPESRVVHEPDPGGPPAGSVTYTELGPATEADDDPAPSETHEPV